jgi:hypothetical protein
MDIYKNKYLKYKSRYIALKNQFGGNEIYEAIIASDDYKTNLSKFIEFLEHKHVSLEDYYAEDWTNCTLNKKGDKLNKTLLLFFYNLGISKDNKLTSLPNTYNIDTFVGIPEDYSLGSHITLDGLTPNDISFIGKLIVATGNTLNKTLMQDYFTPSWQLKNNLTDLFKDPFISFWNEFNKQLSK